MNQTPHNYWNVMYIEGMKGEGHIVIISHLVSLPDVKTTV